MPKTDNKFELKEASEPAQRKKAPNDDQDKKKGSRKDKGKAN